MWVWVPARASVACGSTSNTRTYAVIAVANVPHINKKDDAYRLLLARFSSALPCASMARNAVPRTRLAVYVYRRRIREAPVR